MTLILPANKILHETLERVAREIPGLDKQSIRTHINIARFSSDCTGTYEAHFARYGLSQGRFAVLMVLINAGGPMTPANLADAVSVKRATMTGLVDVLKKGGWVETRRNPDDGRSLVIQLTSKGIARIKDLMPDHLDRMSRALAILTDQEQQDFIDLMQKVSAHVATLSQ